MKRQHAIEVIVDFLDNVERDAGAHKISQIGEVEIRMIKEQVIPEIGHEQFLTFYLYAWRFRN